MIKICKRFFGLYAIVVSLASYASDDVTPKFNEFPCKSPEAWAFQKYGEYNVNEYTGNPGVSIPVYTLTYKDISIPITLSYDGGGIKVRQEASWVGLGWSMNIGGCINYVSQGTNDQKFTTSGNDEQYCRLIDTLSTTINTNRVQFTPSITYPYYHDDNGFLIKSCLDDCSTPDPNIGYFIGDTMVNELKNGYGERDFFSANFLGHSFLFFKNPSDGKYTIIGEESAKYDIHNINDSNSWCITDAAGFTYTFEITERSREGSTLEFISAWCLSRIESPTGAYVVFHYTNSWHTFTSIPDISQTYDLANANNYQDLSGFKSSIVSGTWSVSKKYLHSIVAGDSVKIISFSYGARDDLPGSKRISDITISSSMTPRSPMKYHFNYDYFTSTNTGGSYLFDVNNMPLEQIDDRYKKRLKLTSFDEIGNNGEDTLRTCFEYYGDHESAKLPLKTSCAIDFWGYYNGHENLNFGLIDNSNSYTNHNIIIPSLSDCYGLASNVTDSRIIEVKGANRFSSEANMKIGTLRKITYPTKGSTEFEFEINRYVDDIVLKEVTSSSSYSTYTVTDQNIIPTNPYVNPPVTHQQIELNNHSMGVLTITMSGGNISQIDSLFRYNAYVQFSQVGENNVHTYTMGSLEPDFSGLTFTRIITGIDMPSATYHLTAYLPDEMSRDCKVSATLQVRNILPNTTSDRMSAGAGLRIKKIKNYDINGNLVGYEEYEYEGGKQLVPTRLVEDLIRNKSTDGSPDHMRVYSIKRFHSSSIGGSSFTSSTGKGSIGYSQVSHSIYDGNNLMKKIISCYANEQASYLYNKIYQFDKYSNGSLLSKDVYDENMRLAESYKNYYTPQSEDNYKWNILVEDENINRCNDAFHYNILVYSYANQWNVLSRTEHYTYNESGTNKTETSFNYNTFNKMVSSETTNYNNGRAISAKYYKYPCDSTSLTEFGNMTNANYISPVIDERCLIGGTEQYHKHTHFESRNGLYLPSYIKVSKKGNALEQRMSYSYNNNGNLTCMQNDNQESVTYLWSYKHSYPIAEIKGATNLEVQNWLGAQAIERIANKSTVSEEELKSIQAQITAHGATATMYQIDPLAGVTCKIEANGNSFHYEYDPFLRLSCIKDKHGNIISRNYYNFAKDL